MDVDEIGSERIWQALESVKDPEIPVVSIVEMGIVRDVIVEGDSVTIQLTPTFSGCPAMHVIEAEAMKAVLEVGVQNVQVDTVINPPWTSDWITEEAREKLKDFGLTPPRRHGGRIEITFYDLVPCPYCDSNNTALKNTFGPTLCRSIHYCNECQQPFEQFKAL